MHGLYCNYFKWSSSKSDNWARTYLFHCYMQNKILKNITHNLCIITLHCAEYLIKMVKWDEIVLLQKDEPCPLFLSRRRCSVICCRDDSTHCWLDMEADPAHHTRIIREKSLRLTVLTHLINIIIMCCLSVCDTAALRISSSFYQIIHLILFL